MSFRFVCSIYGVPGQPPCFNKNKRFLLIFWEWIHFCNWRLFDIFWTSIMYRSISSVLHVSRIFLNILWHLYDIEKTFSNKPLELQLSCLNNQFILSVTLVVTVFLSLCWIALWSIWRCLKRGLWVLMWSA